MTPMTLAELRAEDPVLADAVAARLRREPVRPRAAAVNLAATERIRAATRRAQEAAQVAVEAPEPAAVPDRLDVLLRAASDT